MIEMGFEKIEIETARLRLRTFEPDDLETLYRIWSNSDMTRYIRPGWQPTLEDIENYLERTRKRWQERGFSHLAITTKENESLIGYCGFQYVEETPLIELLYGLEPPFWNRGYTTEAARAALRFAYENTELDSIIALSYPENKGSWRVMEKVGMKYEKIAHHYNTDLVYYAITRDEFEHGSAPYVLSLAEFENEI
jgi:ribosomal-protein-alanine N-acetyltransferase